MANLKEPSAHWCRKMRTVFRPWDVEGGSKGYVTEEVFKDGVQRRLEKFPELAPTKDKMYERSHRHWVNHCNLGVKMPEGYRLTESQYVQNAWLLIHSPDFEASLKESSQTFWEGIDREKKGYITKEEATKLGIRVTKDPNLKSTGIFEAMDEKNTGRITFEDTLKAQLFFFTDQDNTTHPFNYVRGALVD
uniref:Okadaic acid binding protein 2-alpha n=1 Tax=Halichondria okadai TaxID=163232 RepID=Q2MHR1_HALOK|nr:okadaic acid binding protein 2-alpha [Halichondria okadai]